MVYREANTATVDITANQRLRQLSVAGRQVRQVVELAEAKKRRRQRAVDEKKAQRKAAAEKKRVSALQMERRRGAMLTVEWVGFLAFMLGPCLLLLAGTSFAVGLLIGPAFAVIGASIFTIPLLAMIVILVRGYRTLAAERAWLRNYPLPLRGHWEALGVQLMHPRIDVEFTGPVPDVELLADVINGVALRLPRTASNALQQGSRHIRVDGQTVSINYKNIADSNRRYWLWSRALLDEVLPVLGGTFCVSAISVDPWDRMNSQKIR